MVYQRVQGFHIFKNFRETKVGRPCVLGTFVRHGVPEVWTPMEEPLDRPSGYSATTHLSDIYDDCKTRAPRSEDHTVLARC